MFCAMLTLLCVVTPTKQIPAGCINPAAGKPVPVFINGIMNDKASALETARQYTIALRKDLNDPTIKVALAYNTSHGFWSDLAEVTAQKTTELSSQKAGAIRAAFFFDDYSLLSGQEAISAANSIKEARTKILSTIYKDANTANDTVEVVSQVYALSGSQKTPILLLPHSQGNLFANDVYAALTSTGKIATNRIAIFGVASPAATVAGVTSPTVADYVTAEEDSVIALSRLRYTAALGHQPALPANVEALTLVQLNNGFNGETHGLSEFYLSDEYAVRKVITAGVGKKIADLTTAVADGYAIEVDWGNAVNVTASTGVPSTVMDAVNTSTPTGACFQLGDLATQAQYITSVRNGSGQNITVNISAAWPGGCSAWSRMVAPGAAVGSTIFPFPVAVFQVMSPSVILAGMDRYILTAM